MERTARLKAMEYASEPESLGRVFKMGGTGDSPVPFGDPPTGTTQSITF
jgi:hypothetical protein